jgi:hypothetical protein
VSGLGIKKAYATLFQKADGSNDALLFRVSQGCVPHECKRSGKSASGMRVALRHPREHCEQQQPTRQSTQGTADAVLSGCHGTAPLPQPLSSPGTSTHQQDARCSTGFSRRETIVRIHMKHCIATIFSALGLVVSFASNAEAAHWRQAATSLKAIAERDRIGDVFAWAISCTPAGLPGNYQIVYANEVGTPDVGYWTFPADPQNGAATSITVKGGTPWAISVDNSVWYKSGTTWYYLPTNKCEGGAITLRQQPGDTAIAVGDAGNIWVVESGGAPTDTLRWWNGSCWVRLPTLPSSVKEVSIWQGAPAGQRYRPWVVTQSGAFYQWNTSNQWELIPNGTGLGVGTYAAIGSDGVSRWTYNFTTNSFDYDSTWNLGAISQLYGQWVIHGDGRTFHWE